VYPLACGAAINAIAATIRGSDCGDPFDPQDYLAGYVLERFSKRKIVGAGKLVAGSFEQPTEELIEAFRTAHEWRGAHVPPMRAMRSELGKLARKIEPYPLTAARLKRMASIRRKLKRGNRTLYQIQDISGCRVILNKMESVDALTKRYVEDLASAHELIDQDDYLAEPKRDGYRSRHLVLKYDGPEEETAGNRLVVELQIRTRMQHAWATAVEAVGFVRKENLKAGEGSADWLRLFQLMSGEIAAMERCPIPSCCSTKERERREEVRHLDRKLGAIRSLESYNQAMWHAENYVGLKGVSYLIQFDVESQQVIVKQYSQYRRAARQYANAEMFSDGNNNAVLVEVDGLAELKSAYPNYFLDVSEFVKGLKVAVHGTAFVIPQRPDPIDPKRERPSRWGDLSFLEKWKSLGRP
jgi:ppGpp synthetase/RelA/SpoT-type nucleotidyltranferase